jgi:hypothetical protein
MSRKHNRSHSKSTVVMAAFLVAVVTFVAFFAYRSCGNAGSTSNSNASASPNPATGSAPGSQPSPRASQPAASPKQEEESVVAPAISGTVKREGTGEAVTDAVVMLFSGDKRKAPPQSVDKLGQFRFEEVRLRPGVTYSLQTKVPGLCGEDTFDLGSVNAQQTIYRDLILKPCQSAAVAPSPTPTNVTDPGFGKISEGLGGIAGPLNTVKVWIQILATTWILTIIMLLSATLALLIPLRNKVEKSRKQIDLLSRPREMEPPKPNQGGTPPTNLLSVPAEVSQTLNKVLVVLEQIASRIEEPAGNGYQHYERQEEPPTQPYSTSAYQSHGRSSLPAPTEWYRDLAQGELRNPPPLYVEINDRESATNPLYPRRIRFDENHHGSFVVFREGDGNGWIFPRPKITLVADHERVFEQINQKNFEQQEPKEVILEDGFWQIRL